MAVVPEKLQWDALFAARTRGEVGGGIAAVLGLLGVPGLISFAGGFPDPVTFPRERASQLLQEFAAHGEVAAFQYAPTRGLPGTLDALAGRIERLQGRRPADDELLVTSGSMEAMELVGKAFLDPGDLVLVEAPTYLGAIMSFRSFEANVVAVPLDDEGLVVDELARRYGFVILEDVAYRELGFADDTPPSLWSGAPELVVQTGTTSKTLFPGVRLGWALAPASVSAQLVAAKQNTDQCAAALGQRLFEEYVRRGWIDEQLAASRALYSRKARLLLDALARTMPPGTRWTEPRGGFFSWLTLPAGGDATDLARRAVDRGVG